MFISDGGAITWSLKKQITITLSEAAHEAVWLRNLYDELSFSQKELVLILDDNDGLLAMVKNPQFHKHSKYIAIQWHYVQEKYKDKVIEAIDIWDPQNMADILTKSLSWKTYSWHVGGLGLKDILGQSDNQW